MKRRGYKLFGLLIVGLLLAAVSFFGGATASAGGSVSFQQEAATSPEGAALYKERCAICHDNPQDRVPPAFLIRRRSAEDVIQTLTTGVMRQLAAGLSADQIRALAIHLTGKLPGAAARGVHVDPEANICKASPGSIDLTAPQWNGWGRDLDNSRFQPEPGLKAEDVPKLKVKWAFAHPGPMATGQPTIIGDCLYVTTEVGLIYCLNAQTGCTYWTVNAGGEVRTSISVGLLPAGAPAKYAAYFGDERSTIHAIDAETGKPLWKTKVEDHLLSRITGAPLLYRDRVYAPVSSFEETAGRDAKYECCKFRGSLVALDACTGKILWKSFTVQDAPKPFKKSSAGTQMYGPAGGAVWSAPTLDLKRKVIYVGTGNSYTDVPTAHSDAIIAYDIETGKIKWANQLTPKDNFLVGCRQPGVGNCPEDAGPDYDFGSSPILRTLPNGKQVLLAGQKSGVIYALDPDNDGKKIWEMRVGAGGALGGIEWGIAADQHNVYAPVSDLGGQADKRRPGITAVNIATGEKIWEKPAPLANCVWGTARCYNAQSAPATVIPGVAFSGAMDGHLRAYSTKDGSVIWDFDTAATPYSGVNGAPAKGGALDGGGPTIAGGMLFVNSGYGRIVGRPGNLLLAFTVDGK
ncbi:MAG TPA: PQQ-binding-like beta-propeller repeat protein [Blastocatellia bacterium]|nr:PQQ-binding-like beta-propeller repeat protein [Blastocatellia bacterium]